MGRWLTERFPLPPAGIQRHEYNLSSEKVTTYFKLSTFGEFWNDSSKESGH
jgi:hypothetical protein